MKTKRLFKTAAILLLTVIFCPIQALACACCADEGEYRISFQKPSAHELSILRDMRFASKANLFETAASDSNDPMSPKSSAGYSVDAALAGRVWKLTFRDGNRTGTLSLPLPPKMLNYAVDTHSSPAGGTGPVLYKEWRFEGRPTATGIFRGNNVTPTSYFLVLQGRGNRCDNAEDFSHWRLELKGPRARYAFFGEMNRS